MGYVYNPQSPGLVACAWLIAILPSLWMPIALERPSLCIYWILYLIVYVPASIIPWYWGQADSRDLLAYVLVLLAVFPLIGIIYRMPLLRIKTSTLSTFGFWFMIALMSVTFYAVIISSFGLKLHFVDPTQEDVYIVRAEFAEMQDSAMAGRLASYAIGWQSNVINCLLISHGLVRRKWLALAVGIIGQLLIYCTTALKSVLFSGVLCMALLPAMWRGGRFFGLLILWGMAGLVLLSAMAYSWFGSETFIAYTRRMIIMPGLLTGQYVDFFSKNPHTMLGDGFLHVFVGYPYSLPPAYLIGEQYYGSSDMAANVNLFAYGYASFGYAGTFIFGLFLALTMWLLDSICRSTSTAMDGDLRIAILMFGIPAISLSNASIVTCIINHGMLLMGIVLYLYPRGASRVSVHLDRPRCRDHLDQPCRC